MFQNVLFRSFAAVALAAALLTATARADSITHGATTINMEFVTVGNPGNAGELSGAGAGGYGPDAIVGAVDYKYRIGKYEVTENQWDAVVAANTSDLLSDPGYWSGEQPAAQFSWLEAAMFCNWLTSGDVTLGAYAINGIGVVTGIDRDSAISTYGSVYVIPTENEWYKAAYYDPNKGGAGVPGYWDYPTKHDSPSVPDGIDYYGDTTFDAVFDDGYDQGHPNDVDNAGVLSAYGTMGQGANVWEWNETAIGSSRGFRGGVWSDNSSILAASRRWYSYPTIEYRYVGFRVANVPEPGSITLLLWGAIAAMKWWRRRR
ncbi:MAG: SUMF1/EgtB/PvdO family nonheme iron enzyme [Planctomycetia bacterium]|nr:SUMF1/EgtB/PvdO family nonheme iron enzyme [Planctomycetia bacterium]